MFAFLHYGYLCYFWFGKLTFGSIFCPTSFSHLYLFLLVNILLSVRPADSFETWVGELTLGCIFVLLVVFSFFFFFDLHLRTFYLSWLDFSLGHSPEYGEWFSLVLFQQAYISLPIAYWTHFDRWSYRDLSRRSTLVLGSNAGFGT